MGVVDLLGRPRRIDMECREPDNTVKVAMVYKVRDDQTSLRDVLCWKHIYFVSSGRFIFMNT